MKPIQPLLRLMTGYYHKVGTEEPDKPLPIRPLHLPRPGQLLRTVVHRLRRTHRHLERQAVGDLPFSRPQHARRPTQHPFLAHRHQPRDQERSARHLPEHRGAHVGPHPVGQIIHEVDHDQGGPSRRCTSNGPCTTSRQPSSISRSCRESSACASTNYSTMVRPLRKRCSSTK